MLDRRQQCSGGGLGAPEGLVFVLQYRAADLRDLASQVSSEAVTGKASSPP